MTKKDRPRSRADTYHAPRSWRIAVVAAAVSMIEAHSETADAATRRIVANRVGKLCDVLSFHYTWDDFTPAGRTDGPFLPEDAAELVLVEEHRAHRLATRIFGKRIADVHFYPGEGRINMDWLREWRR